MTAGAFNLLRRRHTERPLGVAAVVLAALVAAGAALSIFGSQPGVLLNTTPSEPIGLYRAARRPVQRGAIIAFKTPSAAFPYADLQLGYLHHETLLKAVAAGPGDCVCTTTGRLMINGRDLAPIVLRDGQGRGLPHWRGCRTLRAAEWFVFSDRTPNSFDSRYFGPVSAEAIVGVFVPLLLAGEAL